MNPLYQALKGAVSPFSSGMGNVPSAAPSGPLGALQNVMQRAQQIASTVRDPRQMVQQYFPDAPTEIRNDPDQLIGWLQQTGKVSPQMIQMARQMLGR